MSKPIKRVAVIGAGPAGAIAVHTLAQEQTFDVLRVFDRRSKIGGLWTFTPELAPKLHSLGELVELQNNADKTVAIPTNLPTRTRKTPAINDHRIRFSDSAVHDHLESNIPAEVMSFTQEPFPDTAPPFPKFGKSSPFRHREVIRSWVEGIFKRHGHDKLLELQTTVELAEKVGNEWILTLRKESPGDAEELWLQEKFDAIVVANGHYNVPNFPQVKGLVEFENRYPGTVLHSKHYRRPEDYRNKKVIVVGGSVSAIDITHEVIHFAQAPVYSSMRGANPVFGSIPFEHPLVEIKPVISHIVSHGGKKIVFFSDGTQVENVDHIIFGTGYTFSLPFLPSVSIVNRIVPGLYLHVFKQDDPTLAFIGGVAGGFTFRVFEWQATAIARLFAGRTTLPPVEEQQKWASNRLLKFPGGGFPFIKIGDDFEGYFEQLRALAGEPKDGEPGHVLPKFDQTWVETFAGTLQDKIAYWKKSKEIVERHLRAQKDGWPYDKLERPVWGEKSDAPIRSKL